MSYATLDFSAANCFVWRSKTNLFRSLAGREVPQAGSTLFVLPPLQLWLRVPLVAAELAAEIT